ncbi:hypothetical protein WJX75_009137 [Coccomyxa subellipsoidea]|uniref:L domain-like protein n=1 Tax=Coccomyxa subellipsoidea TaxID=248742 RepID=A0ABR2Z4D2_9CHLO
MNAKMSGLDALGSVEHIATFHALPRRPAFGSRRPILTRALFSKKQKQAAPSKLKDTPPKQSFLSGVVEALDFAEARSTNDAKLIYQAKQKKKGQRLSPEEARALRRKVGGTANNYFKEWVDVKGKYAEKGYISGECEELDLTGSHLPDLSAVELPDNLKALDLTRNRLRSLDTRLLALAGLHTLTLRQNILTDVSQLGSCAFRAVLKELILHDNQIKDIPALSDFTSLQRLELSYNQIQSLQPLQSLGSTGLTDLYVANNAIQKIEAVHQFTNLRLLELGSNKIRNITGLEGLTNLQELWLGRNRIAEINGLDSLMALRILSLQSNRLTSMAGLAHCSLLEELYLSHNGIQCLQGLESLPKLRVLDVSSNQLEQLDDELVSKS